MATPIVPSSSINDFLANTNLRQGDLFQKSPPLTSATTSAGASIFGATYPSQGNKLDYTVSVESAENGVVVRCIDIATGGRKTFICSSFDELATILKMGISLQALEGKK